MRINIPVSVGELVDKISILEIKDMKITDKEKLKNINYELSELKDISKKVKSKNVKEFDINFNKLLEINNELWEIEDSIRKLESKNQFDEDFINIARKIYKLNDQRFKIKQNINLIFGSQLIEEKEYEKYF